MKCERKRDRKMGDRKMGEGVGPRRAERWLAEKMKCERKRDRKMGDRKMGVGVGPGRAERWLAEKCGVGGRATGIWVTENGKMQLWKSERSSLHFSANHLFAYTYAHSATYRVGKDWEGTSFLRRRRGFRRSLRPRRQERVVCDAAFQLHR